MLFGRVQSGLVEVYEETNRLVAECLDLLIYSMCLRCARDRKLVDVGKRFHHCGRFYRHISGNYTEHQVRSWLTDLEHGFLHGLSTLFMAGLVIEDELSLARELIAVGGELLLVKEKNLQSRHVGPAPENVETYSDFTSRHSTTALSFEKLAASCLLHDFEKSQGHPQEGHDTVLCHHFPDLLAETYTHACPPDSRHPLVLADVLELRRFPDHASWYRPGVLEQTLSGRQVAMASCYYNNVRPALAVVFEGRHETWLRFGPEVPQALDRPDYPQHPFDWFPVETDRLPFENCFVHDNDQPSAPWSVLKGVIRLSHLRQIGGRVRPHMEFVRDHLFVRCQARWEDWCFVTDQEVVPHAGWVPGLLSGLLERGQKVVDRDVVNRFVRAADMVQDRLLCLSESGV